jgi:hypothetical protein
MRRQPRQRTADTILNARPSDQNHVRRDARHGVRGLLIYCADYRCSHSIAISADNWPDDLRLSDIEPRFVCQVCGKRGADVRPDFNSSRRSAVLMGYR